MNNQARSEDIENTDTDQMGDHKSWKEEPLGENCEVITGNNFSSDKYVEYGVPLIRISNLDNGTISKEDLVRLPESELKSLDQKYILREGDTLIGMSGSIGKLGVIGKEESPSILNQRVGKFRPEKGLNKIFLRFVIESHEYQRYVYALAAGGAQSNISASDLKIINIPYPPLSEQQRIASVLYSVDQAIQKTEKIIEQTQRVKKGLMQDLFTEGYFEHEKFEESRTGPIAISIPKNWSLKTIPDVFEIIDGDRGKSYPGTSELHENGHCLFLNAGNVTAEGLKFSETEFVTKGKDEEMGKGKLERGDLIITTRGTVGNIGFYSSDVDYDHMRINSGMIILRPKVECDRSYFYHLFNSEIFQKQINNASYGTAQPQISVSLAEKLEIVVPSLEEQKNIAKILDSLDQKIQKNKDQKKHLQLVKRGLMQDLLTGKVRTDGDVEVLEEVVEYE